MCYLLQNALFFRLREVRGIPFRQSRASVAADEEETVDHGFKPIVSIIITWFKYIVW